MLSERELALAIIDNDQLPKSDAIVLLEGDGDNRCAHAAKLLLNGFAKKLIFSGNSVEYAYGSYPLEDLRPKLAQLGVSDKLIVHEAHSMNTREQALEVVQLASQNGWSKLILVASNYHQYRAYLTFLKVVLESKMPLLIYNAPVRDLHWFSETGWGTRFELLLGEFARIEKYAKQGHLASYKEAIEYQRWKETQT